MNKIYAEISAGELVDKITILKIKKEKITNLGSSKHLMGLQFFFSKLNKIMNNKSQR